MYGKITEFFVKLIYRKRFAQADTIAEAATKAGKGEIDNALAILDVLAPEIHPSLRGIFGLTRSRILASIGRLKEAEKSLIAAAKAEPSDGKIHLELAIMAGRCFRYESARERLKKLVEEADPDTAKEASGILPLLDSILSGERLAEFEKRAANMSQKAMGKAGETPGLPADLELIDNWISRCPEEAQAHADDIALLVGHSETLNGATWKISLALEDSVVTKDDTGELNPFRCVSQRLAGDDQPLAMLVADSWESPQPT